MVGLERPSSPAALVVLCIDLRGRLGLSGWLDVNREGLHVVEQEPAECGEVFLFGCLPDVFCRFRIYKVDITG